MGVFSLEDPVGMVKRFEVGEYRSNLLPLIYTKTRNMKNPLNGQQTFAMSVEVEKDGELYDVLEIGLKEVFS